MNFQNIIVLKIKMPTYEFCIKLSFVRTNKKCIEPNPTEEEIDNFFRGYNSDGVRRYVEFVRGLYVTDYLDYLPEEIHVKNCRYTKDGVIFFTLDTEESHTIDDLLSYLKNESLEDGLWEGKPGESGVFPVRATIFQKTPEELGVFDYRPLKHFTVTSN